MDSSEIQQKRDEKWIESSFTIEVMAMNPETAVKALDNHVEKLSNDVSIYEKNFMDTVKIDNPTKDIKEAHSRIVELKLFAENLHTLIKTVMLYGPSSVEILGPSELKINVEELQRLSNDVGSLVHQFAAAGAGGIVISPK